MTAHYQNTERLRFKVPLVPFLPALSILCNLEFIVHLNVLTWLRFFVWMILGKIGGGWLEENFNFKLLYRYINLFPLWYTS